MKGNILVIDTGSTSTKIGYFKAGTMVFEDKLSHSADELKKFKTIMAQELMRKTAILNFLQSKNIALTDIDIVMSRGGLFSPVKCGVYKVNRDMRDVLMTCRDGVHACNLSPILADDITEMVNEIRYREGINSEFGPCHAYIVDAPMSDELLPECKIGGSPEFPRMAFFHALNSRATIREYMRRHNLQYNKFTAIVAHMGGGITVSLHKDGKAIDTNNGLGGDGPFTPERTGTVPAFPLVEMCFSGEYSKEEIKKKLVGRGGAVAFFGTNDIGELQKRANGGDEECEVFLKAFNLNIAKYIASAAATVCGKVDVILLTGGIAFNQEVCDAIAERVSFIAPVEVYPGEHELDSLGYNGYEILSGKAEINIYDKNV